ncbi:MAG: alpha-amylase/4-alpha-glucanotransferase domain-containing protein [Treponema sp.]
MNSLCVCFGLESAPAGMTLPDSEKDYLDVYKPAATFLYSHPDCSLSFSFSGNQLQFFKKKHPEFLEILQQLTSRKQVEVLGGGFYNPVFPLLFPIDRSGQVDMLSAEIRQTTGKRPRGMTVCASSWDTSLVTSLETCGIEYVLLDSSIIAPSKLMYLPVIMSDRGKSIDIIPFYRKYKPSEEVSAEEYLSLLFSSVKKNVHGDCYDRDENERYVDILFSHEEFHQLLKSGYLFSIYETAKEKFSSTIHFSYPSSYRRIAPVRVPAFITAGLSSDIAQWAKIPYTSVTKNDGYPVTIYDFLQTYPQSLALCCRMLYVSMLINQYHGDKARKKAAREKLWAAQSGEGFVCTSKGSLVNSTYRQKAYRCLNEAEMIVRDCGKFDESISSFDYDGDGTDEYICRMLNYTSCIKLLSGEIYELDVMQSASNYADNPSRIEEFDGCTDGYYRGMFVDHIFSDNDIGKYLKNEPSGTGIFSQLKYSETRFSGQHNEIQLFAQAEFGERKQKISLRKKYLANSNGFTIQYILKNESSSPLHANFVVESNFAQTNYTEGNFVPYKVEIVSSAQRKEIDTTKSASEIDRSGSLSDVSVVQISDYENGLSFMFEPNENCGFYFVPIIFMRPEYNGTKIVPAEMTFTTAMLWPVQLEPGMEMEKTVNFSILNLNRRNSKKIEKRK